MAVFMNNGGGDYYGGPTKEDVLRQMADGLGEFDIEEAFEVPGTTKMRASNENDEPTEELTTLEEEYDESLGAYLVASENC